MANLTIAVDDELLRRARVRAASQGTSVNAVLREELERYAGEPGSRPIDGFLELARKARGGSGGVPWSREDLYAERLGLE